MYLIYLLFKEYYTRPLIDEDTARKVLNKHYGLSDVAKLSDLESYDDRNFRVELNNGQVYTLKFHNGVETDNLPLIQAQDQLLSFLFNAGITCPAPEPTKTGVTIAFEPLFVVGTPDQTRSIAIRLLSWVHGAPMNTISTTKELLTKAGAFFGRLSLKLDEFDHIGAHRIHQWDLAQTESIETFMHGLTDSKQRQLVQQVVDEFRERVKPKISQLRHGILQADFNDANIIVQDGKLAGVIDFGDMVYSARVNDVAIALAYAMLTSYGRDSSPLMAACAFLQGFAQHYTLQAVEIELLYTLISCRLATSVTLGLYSYMQQPENQYLLLHAKPGWQALSFLRQQDPEQVTKAFQEALEVILT